MSKLSEEKRDFMEDLYLEHSQHSTYEPKCSECFKNVKEFDEDEADKELAIDEFNKLELKAEILEEQRKEEVAMGEPHPCRWCGTPTLNLECDACDKKNDEAYFERHGEDPFADDKQRDLLNDR